MLEQQDITVFFAPCGIFSCPVSPKFKQLLKNPCIICHSLRLFAPLDFMTNNRYSIAYVS